MFLLRLLCVFAFATFIAVADEEIVHFRDDYVYNSNLSAFYKEHRTPQRWSDALVTCRAEGAEFVLPATGEEVDLMLQLSNSSNLWVAASDIYSEGDFLTVDGKSISEFYLNWRAGEPNNVNDAENCIIMDRSGTYIDVSCNGYHRFFCKRNANNLTQNAPCQTYDMDYTYSKQLNSCYKFHSLPLSWHQAFKTCKAEQASLAIINSKDEVSLITRMFNNYPEASLKGNFQKNALHLGFSDLLSNGFYLTTDGKFLSETGYEIWSPGQPDNYQNKEHCGSMFRDGSLNDLNCESRAMFVCEKSITMIVL